MSILPATLCTVYAWHPWRSEGGIISLQLELEMVFWKRPTTGPSLRSTILVLNPPFRKFHSLVQGQMSHIPTYSFQSSLLLGVL